MLHKNSVDVAACGQPMRATLGPTLVLRAENVILAKLVYVSFPLTIEVSIFRAYLLILFAAARKKTKHYSTRHD